MDFSHFLASSSSFFFSDALALDEAEDGGAIAARASDICLSTLALP
jgi:hypothetical protein